MNSAQASYEVWYTLAGKDKGYEQYSVMLQDSQFRDFFDSVINAQFKVMFIDISCLFEPHERASSFYGLKNLLKDDGYDDVVDRIECAISLHKNLIWRIKGNRDKRIAHHVTTWTEEKMLDKYGVTPNAIRSLLETEPLAKSARRAAFLPDLRLLRWDRPTLLSIMGCQQITA